MNDETYAGDTEVTWGRWELCESYKCDCEEPGDDDTPCCEQPCSLRSEICIHSVSPGGQPDYEEIDYRCQVHACEMQKDYLPLESSNLGITRMHTYIPGWRCWE